MLREKSVFKFFSVVSKFFGFSPKNLNKYEKVRALLMFFIFCVLNNLLLIIELLTTDDHAVIIKGIQIFPSFMITLLNAFNFFDKYGKIENLFKELDEIIKRSEDKNLFEKHYQKALYFVFIQSGFDCLGALSYILIFLVTGVSGIPNYLATNHENFFYFTWANQACFIIYSFLNTSLLQTNFFVKFNIASGCTEVLGNKFQNMKLNKDEIKSCLEEHIRLKR